MQQPQSYSFEIFCIDPNGQTEILTEKSMIQALSYSSKLWSDGVKDTSGKGRYSITDEKSKIYIIIKSVDISKVLTDYIESAFIIIIESDDFESLEEFRVKILKHIRDKLKFAHVRVLSDDISTSIAQKLYPLVNKVENLLRKYLTKFFIQRVGLDWWDVTATKTMIDKVKIRKSDRKDEFSTLSNTDVSLTDFDDLGELIYKQSSGFNNPEKVVEKILTIVSTEELENFKSELKGNYTKYFKEFFRDKDFETQWRELFKIRNKVAHHGIFYLNELEKGITLTKSLTDIILEAESKIDEIVFSVEDKEAIRNATIEAISESEEVKVNERNIAPKLPGVKVVDKIELQQSNRLRTDNYTGFYKVISEDELLNELESCQTNQFNDYVGLKWFATSYLANKGFSIGLTYSLINILIDKQKIILYDVDSGDFIVKAIRLSVEE